jgi:hypothetical protein
MVTTGSGSDGFGSGWMGIILVALLFGGGRGGLFGGGSASEGINLNTNIDTRFNQLESHMDYDSIKAGQFGLERSIFEVGARADGKIQEQTYQIARGQDSINRNIDSVKYDNLLISKEALFAGERNTDRLIAETSRQGEETRKLIERNYTRELEEKICLLRSDRDKLEIIANQERLAFPQRAVPAYATPPPVAAPYGYGYGFAG